MSLNPISFSKTVDLYKGFVYRKGPPGDKFLVTTEQQQVSYFGFENLRILQNPVNVRPGTNEDTEEVGKKK